MESSGGGGEKVPGREREREREATSSLFRGVSWSPLFPAGVTGCGQARSMAAEVQETGGRVTNGSKLLLSSEEAAAAAAEVLVESDACDIIIRWL